jgi:hypothetical protein
MENESPVRNTEFRVAVRASMEQMTKDLLGALRQMERNILAAFRAAEEEPAALHARAVARHETWVRMNALSDRIRALEMRPRL